MRGTVARRLRKLASERFPEGSRLGVAPRTPKNAGGFLFYDGYVRLYRSLKNSWRDRANNPYLRDRS